MDWQHMRARRWEWWHLVLTLGFFGVVVPIVVLGYVLYCRWLVQWLIQVLEPR